jgi:hypothetical protein
VVNEASIAKTKQINELNNLVDESKQKGVNKLVDQRTRLYMN